MGIGYLYEGVLVWVNKKTTKKPPTSCFSSSLVLADHAFNLCISRELLLRLPCT